VARSARRSRTRAGRRPRTRLNGPGGRSGRQKHLAQSRAGAQPQPSSPTRSLLDGPWRDAPPEALPHGHHYYVDDSIRRRSPVASQTRA
jgi:hypothetical protein